MAGKTAGSANPQSGYRQRRAALQSLEERFSLFGVLLQDSDTEILFHQFPYHNFHPSQRPQYGKGSVKACTGLCPWEVTNDVQEQERTLWHHGSTWLVGVMVVLMGMVVREGGRGLPFK